MSAVIVELADAVVDALRGLDLGQSAHVQRQYAGRQTLHGGKSLTIYVVPKALDEARSNRNQWQQDYQVDIVILSKLGEAPSEGDIEIDALMEIGDAIRTELKTHVDGAYLTAGTLGCQLVSITTAVPYDPAILREEQAFGAQITATYRGIG